MVERKKRDSRPGHIPTSRIVGRSLIVAATLTRNWMFSILDLLAGLIRPDGLQSLPSTLADAIASSFVTLRQDHLEAVSDSFLAGWIIGTDQVLRVTPPSLLKPLQPVGTAEIVEATTIDITAPQRLAPTTRYPALERAAQRIQEKRIALPEDFASVYSSGEQSVLPFIQQIIDDAAVETGDLIREATLKGHSFKTFKKDFEANIGTTASHKLEGLYRDTVNEAISKGKRDTIEHPMVSPAFPYVWTSPIRDGRLTELCEIVSKSGINNTPVYRRDDPLWDIFEPPRHYNCRCSWFPATAKFVARKFNVPEAKQWAKTGVPPTNPAHMSFPRMPQEAKDLLESWLSK